MRVIRRIALAALATGLCLHARAQQPQTSTAPLYAVNAKYANGVAPGYWATAGSGLTLNLSQGTANCGTGTIAAYAGGTLAMTASTTNYVYLNTASSCVPAVKTSAFVAADIPIAVVVTSGSAITGITDDRTMFNVPPTGGNMNFTSPGAWNGTSAYSVGAVVTYSGASYVCNTAVTAPATATLIQAKSANNASSLAFTSNVTSGDLLIAIVGRVIGGTENVGSATVTDTLSGLGWTKAVDTGSNSSAASGVWYFRATATGAAIVSFTGGGSDTPQIAIMEFSGLQGATGGTASGYVGSGVPATVNITPSPSGSTLIAAIVGSFNSTYSAASGFTIPANGQAATFTSGSVAVDYQIGVATSTYAAGFSSASSSNYATAVAAFRAATSNDTPDMDGGHWTRLGSAPIANCVGDAGTGGVAGLAPAPGAGDTAAGKFLRADCTYAVPGTSLLLPAYIQQSTAVPTVASLTAVNQSTSTATDTAAGIYMVQPSTATQYIFGLFQTKPGTTWTYTAAIEAPIWPTSGIADGVCITDGTKIITFGAEYNGGAYPSPIIYYVTKWTSATAYSGDYTGLLGFPLNVSSATVWYRIQDDATNLTYSVSYDGVNFVPVKQTTRTDFLTTTKIGACVKAQNAGGVSANQTVSSWKATTP